MPSNVILAKRDATALAPITLNAGTIFVHQLNRDTNGQVEFFFPAVLDQRYLIQATTNFIDWLNL